MSQSLRRAAAAHVAAMPVAVLALALAVSSSATVVRLDHLASAGVHAGAVDPLIAAGLVVTLLGATKTVFAIGAVCAAILLAARLWHGALALALAVGLTQVVVAALKEVVARPRPAANADVTGASGFSFPSGHSATSAALFGVLAIAAASHAPRRARVALAVAGVVAIVAVGASRVLLGAHYPTDVLAGWLTGATIAALSWWALWRLRHGGLTLRRAHQVASIGELTTHAVYKSPTLPGWPPARRSGN